MQLPLKNKKDKNTFSSSPMFPLQFICFAFHQLLHRAFPLHCVCVCVLPLRLYLLHFSRPVLPDEFRDGFWKRQIVVWPRGRVRGLQLYSSCSGSLSCCGLSPRMPAKVSCPVSVHFSWCSSVSPAGQSGDVMGWIRGINQLVFSEAEPRLQGR